MPLSIRSEAAPGADQRLTRTVGGHQSDLSGVGRKDAVPDAAYYRRVRLALVWVMHGPVLGLRWVGRGCRPAGGIRRPLSGR